MSIRRYVLDNYEAALTRALPRNKLGDTIFATVIHLRAHRRWPREPALFNDYLWRMKVSGELYDPLRQFVSDKEFGKLYVKGIAGDEYNIPTCCVIRSEREIDVNAIPERCAIKPTHSTGHVIVRLTDDPLDPAALRALFHSKNPYNKGRQQNYRFLRPKLIVEELALGMERPMDYKIFCYGGEPKIFAVYDSDEGGRRQTFLDPGWRPYEFRSALRRHERPIERPECLEEMLDVARRLARPFGLIRVDLYTDNRRFVVGELTNCHASGVARFASRADEEGFSRALFG